jgi:ADP-ribosyl-[dinitrogen reductase] hydrolase
MIHPNPNMLLRIAQGDAYGMATEYIKLPEFKAVRERALGFGGYGKHPLFEIEAGHYTDDTQMSIAVAEVLLDGKMGVSDIDEETLLKGRFAEAFVRCFKRDPRRGYSRALQGVLESVEDGKGLMAKVSGTSDMNGSAMRAVPIGVLENPVDVVHVAMCQSEITHDSPGGNAASMAVALMSHFALHTDEPFSRLPEWLAEELPLVQDWLLEPWPGGPVDGSGTGIKTARAVLTLLTTEEILMGVARTALEWGGDTDSVLAIAWGIASARMTENVPKFFDEGLENGAYGRDFLKDLGLRLMAMHGGARVQYLRGGR